MTALFLDASPADYHARTGAPPRLSQSIAKIIVDRSPWHAKRRLDFGERDEPIEESARKTMDFGSVAHELLLGTGKGFAVAQWAPPPTLEEQLAASVAQPGAKPPKKPRAKATDKPPPPGPFGDPEWQNWQRGDAKAAKAAIRDRGLVPLLPKDLRRAEKLADRIREDLDRLGIRLDGRSELAAEWEENAGGMAVPCRGQADHVVLSEGRGIVYDLKIWDTGNPRALRYKLPDMGVDIQAAAYTSAIEHVVPRLAGRVSFVALVCEVGSGLVTDVPMGGTMKRLGELRWQRACRTFAWCIEHDLWPAYERGHPIDVPEHRLAEEEAAAIAEAHERSAADVARYVRPTPAEQEEAQEDEDDGNGTDDDVF